MSESKVKKKFDTSLAAQLKFVERRIEYIERRITSFDRMNAVDGAARSRQDLKLEKAVKASLLKLEGYGEKC